MNQTNPEIHLKRIKSAEFFAARGECPCRKQPCAYRKCPFYTSDDKCTAGILQAQYPDRLNTIRYWQDTLAALQSRETCDRLKTLLED